MRVVQMVLRAAVRGLREASRVSVARVSGDVEFANVLVLFSVCSVVQSPSWGVHFVLAKGTGNRLRWPTASGSGRFALCSLTS